MKIIDKHNENSPISIKSFMVSGEHDQGDTAVLCYDEVYDLVHAAKTLYEAVCGLEGESFSKAKELYLDTVK